MHASWRFRPLRSAKENSQSSKSLVSHHPVLPHDPFLSTDLRLWGDLQESFNAEGTCTRRWAAWKLVSGRS